MNRGILFALTTALVVSSLACRHPADPAQIATVDSLTNAMEAANMTLNELNLDHYQKATTLLDADRALYRDRFQDTLDKATALTLAGHFNRLREATHMSDDHASVQEATGTSAKRLRALHTDLEAGSLDPDAAARAILIELRIAKNMDSLVQQVIMNYRSTQLALTLQPKVDSLLAKLPESQATR